MRKYAYFLLGLLCGAVFFSGTAVMANSGFLAEISSQIFFLNGEQTELFAYNINGNNYVKLRDAAALFGADIEYIEETNSVHMEIPKKEKTEDVSEDTPDDTPVVTPDIFIDGRWQIIDVSYYDVARTDESLFTNSYPRINTTKEKTEFAKELLVPGSTALKRKQSAVLNTTHAPLLLLQQPQPTRTTTQ